MSFNSDVLNGFKQPADSTSAITGGIDNQLFIYGSIDAGGVLLTSYMLQQNNVITYNAAGALTISGIAIINGGTGFAMTLAAPQAGSRLNIILSSITSGSVTVTLPIGVTFDGVNSIATFSAANARLEIVYLSPTSWQIIYNNSVTLS